ncbi:hypothetical protein MKX03_002909 [Papaver bracteatum]|nr:hypothetical protein MKX03_002909 [Papaver bracteatum]
MFASTNIVVYTLALITSYFVLDIRSLTLSRLKLQTHQVSDQLVDNNAHEALPATASLIGGHSKDLSDVVTGISVSLYLPHLHTIRLRFFSVPFPDHPRFSYRFADFSL